MGGQYSLDSPETGPVCCSGGSELNPQEGERSLALAQPGLGELNARLTVTATCSWPRDGDWIILRLRSHDGEPVAIGSRSGGWADELPTGLPRPLVADVEHDVDQCHGLKGPCHRQWAGVDGTEADRLGQLEHRCFR